MGFVVADSNQHGSTEPRHGLSCRPYRMLARTIRGLLLFLLSSPLFHRVPPDAQTISVEGRNHGWPEFPSDLDTRFSLAAYPFHADPADFHPAEEYSDHVQDASNHVRSSPLLAEAAGADPVGGLSPAGHRAKAV